jgi:hypothetical protein
MNLKLSAVLLGAATILQASATTITFENTAFGDGGIHYISNYSENGFTVASAKASTGSLFGVFGSTHPWNVGSTALYNNYPAFGSVVTRNGGGLFDVRSIDLFELIQPGKTLNSQPAGIPPTITFEGWNGATKVASQVFTLDGLVGGQTLLLSSSFSDLTSFNFKSNGTILNNMAQFDNIVVSPVPDGGSSLALIGVAFGALGFVRRFTAKA